MAEKKKLRAPTQKERAEGLPKTKKEAIARGLTRFIPEDGVERIIRNYGSASAPNGRVATAPNRAATRGGGSDGTRAFNERLGSPQGTDHAEGNAAMQRIRTANPGMDVDHRYSIGPLAEGVRWKVQQGRGTHQEFFDNYEKAGIHVGHVEGNFQPLDPDTNQRVKPQEERALWDHLNNETGKEAKRIFDAARNLNFATTTGYQPTALGGFVFGEQNNQRSMPQTPYTPPTQGGYVHRNRGPSETAPVGEPGVDRTIPVMDHDTIRKGVAMVGGVAAAVFTAARDAVFGFGI